MVRPLFRLRSLCARPPRRPGVGQSILGGCFSTLSRKRWDKEGRKVCCWHPLTYSYLAGWRRIKRRGHVYMTSAQGGGTGYPKSRCNKLAQQGRFRENTAGGGKKICRRHIYMVPKLNDLGNFLVNWRQLISKALHRRENLLPSRRR